MADIHIRNLDPRTFQRLEAQAKRNGRTLHDEAKAILEQAVGAPCTQVQAILDNWSRRLAGRHFDDSTDLIREDRER